MKEKFLLLFLTTLMYDLYAQQRSALGNFVYADTKLISIEYFGAGIIEITKDDDFTKFNKFGLDSLGKTSPIAYESGSTPIVRVKFSFCVDTVWVKGKGPDNHIFTSKQLVNKNGGSFYTNKSSSIFEKNKVKYYDPFEITWYISKDNINFVEVGKSNHQLYVTYDKPLAKSDILPFHKNIYHTLIHYGCKNANGLNNIDKIIDEVFQKTFIETNRKIKRIDKPTTDAMTYWGTSTSTVSGYLFDVENLIYTEDATCGAWADFFNRMLLTQGFDTTQVATVNVFWDKQNWGEELPKALENEMKADFNAVFGSSATISQIKKDTFNSMFFVKNWNFPNKNKFYSEKDTLFIKKDTLTNPLLVFPADELGLPAQGNNNPRAWFQNHALVHYNNRYYDPSYGSSLGVLPAVWEDAAIKAFGTTFYISYTDYKDGEIKTEKLAHWVKEYNIPNKSQVIIYH